MPSSRRSGPVSGGNDSSSPRVYGCRGSREQRVGRRGLDDLAGVHDRDPVGELDQQRQVVRDEEHREAELALQVWICWRISRCTTTSSAVVGSSMITSSGLSASAIAMITRWRMPPESSCG